MAEQNKIILRGKSNFAQTCLMPTGYPYHRLPRQICHAVATIYSHLRKWSRHYANSGALSHLTRYTCA
eukprot:scaffold533632_cov17-Prasinocladus_malaysianus.AAC.1